MVSMNYGALLVRTWVHREQPDVLHIHPEAKVEANNKVLTAYVEGGEELETPIRDVGLNGTGEVIGVTDTGLDDNSCFFRDDVHGMVPRWVRVVDGVEDKRMFDPVFDPMVGSREGVFVERLEDLSGEASLYRRVGVGRTSGGEASYRCAKK